VLVVILSASASAHAETVAVLGDGADLAREITADGREILGPSTARSLLEAKRGSTGRDPAAARALAAAGREAYAGAFFDEAVDQLARAAATYLATGLTGVGAPELAAVHLDLGLAHLAAGHREPAEREVALALRLQADIAPGPAHGPPVRRFVESVRAGLPRARVLSRTIATDPPGASLVLDGRDRGTSPVVVADLAVGSHLVVASAPGRAAVAVRVEVTDRTDDPLTVALPGEDAAQAALDALDAGDLDRAASLGRTVLEVETAIAVAHDAQGARAVLAGAGGTREARGRDARAIAQVLFPGSRTRDDRAAVALASPASPANADDESGGAIWWWLAGGAAVVAAGVVAGVLLLEPDEPGARTVVPQFR